MIRSQDALMGDSARRIVDRVEADGRCRAERQPERLSPTRAIPPDLRALRLSICDRNPRGRNVPEIDGVPQFFSIIRPWLERFNHPEPPGRLPDVLATLE